jgi:hypothetical protein
MYKIPHEVSTYIRGHFKEYYHFDFSSEKNKEGNIIYKVELHENEILHLLEFNQKGKIIKHDTLPIFEEDFYEGNFYGKKE